MRRRADSIKESSRIWFVALGNYEREIRAPWVVLPGLGIRVSDTDRPEPDVLVIPPTKGGDLRWKRAAYTGLASLTHYVVIAQDTIEVVVFARDEDFSEQGFAQSINRSNCARSELPCRWRRSTVTPGLVPIG